MLSNSPFTRSSLSRTPLDDAMFFRDRGLGMGAPQGQSLGSLPTQSPGLGLGLGMGMGPGMGMGMGPGAGGIASSSPSMVGRGPYGSFVL